MEGHRLRRATRADIEALHALLAVPEVNEFLADGVAPPREAVVAWIDKSIVDFADAGIGVWLMDGDDGRLMACVRLEYFADRRIAELSYLLAPEAWGRGLATRIASAALRAAFASGVVDRVFAGADGPNHRSIAVMKRLGMRFARDVEYPLGPGVEYELSATDPAVSSLQSGVPLDIPAGSDTAVGAAGPST